MLGTRDNVDAIVDRSPSSRELCRSGVGVEAVGYVVKPLGKLPQDVFPALRRCVQLIVELRDVL